MIDLSSLPVASVSNVMRSCLRPSDDAEASLDEVLARLTACVAAIETDSAAFSGAVALARNRSALYAAMDALGSWINGFLATEPSATELEAAKTCITDLIHLWSRTGPFFDRCFAQRRGHPADFETLEIIYKCRPGGADVRARIFDDYYLHTVVAHTIRHRLTYLTSWLVKETEDRAVRGIFPVRVLSLGIGPGRELRMLAEDPVFREVAAITCLDSDAEALRFVRNRLQDNRDYRITYLRADPLRFARGPGRPSKPYHLIYAAGLFDYLAPDQAWDLIEDCYGLLMSGGRLAVSNLSTSVPANEQALLDWLLTRRPWYRNEQDFRSILAGTSFASGTWHCEHKAMAANLFVVAERPG